MKKIISLFIALVTILSLCAIPTTAASYDAGDWVKSGAGARSATYTKNNDGTITVEHDGYYPDSNAGILYGKPLDLSTGVEMEVRLDVAFDTKEDAWFGFSVLNRPVYFDWNAKSPEHGYGFVFLARPDLETGITDIQWFVLDGVTPWVIVDRVTSDALGNIDYTQAGATIKLKVTTANGPLEIYINDYKVDFDPSSIVDEYFEGGNEAYIGFSTSYATRTQQMFTVMSLNGDVPVATGDFNTDSSTDEKIDFDNVDEFVLYDFTKEENCKDLVTDHCTAEYDPIEGCLKVTLIEDTTNGFAPYLYIPMTKNTRFPASSTDADGNFVEEFTMAVLNMKTSFASECDFYFTTNKVTDLHRNHIGASYEVCEDYTDVEFDMLMDDNFNWANTITALRFDPVADDAQEFAGSVFYLKSVTMKRYTGTTPDEETTANGSNTPSGDTTDNSSDTGVSGNDTTSVTDNKGNAVGGDDNKGGLSTPVIIAIVAAAVVVVAVVAFVVVKKKK